jgi:hypothetical protein
VNTGLPSAASVRFINNTYVASVAENAPYGTFVARRSCTRHRLLGPACIYTITSGNENNAFSIDSVTGTDELYLYTMIFCLDTIAFIFILWK